MSISTILIWLLPAVLVILIGLRIQRTKKNDAIQKPSNLKRTLVLLAGCSATIIAIAFFLIVGRKNSKSAANNPTNSVPICPTAISPQVFSNTLGQSEGHIEGVFHAKKFITEKSGYDEVVENKVKHYSYTKYELYYDSTKFGVIANGALKEGVVINSKYPGFMFYYIEDNNRYQGFFNYLKSIGADSLINEKYEGYEYRLHDLRSYKYANCVFSDRDWDTSNQMYMIKIFSSDHLRLKKDTSLTK